MRVCQFRHIRLLRQENFTILSKPRERSQRRACANYRTTSTSTPMLRAVPATERLAASISKQFRSGILIFAISSICALVILPTLVLCGSADPFAKLTARLISTGTGGVFVINVNERSEKIVITTG